MRILFDITRPYHARLFAPVVELCRQDAHTVFLAVRDAGPTVKMLRDTSASIRLVSRVSGRALLRPAEWAARQAQVIQLIDEHRIDLCFTVPEWSGIGVAAQCSRIPVAMMVTDRLPSWKALAALRLARYVINAGRAGGQRAPCRFWYPGIPQSLYLHPDRYQPDWHIRSRLDVAADQPYFVLRFRRWEQAHEPLEEGLTAAHKWVLLRLFERYGRVYVSTDEPLPDELEAFALNLSPARFLDVLAGAKAVVSDSPVVTAEAALLGVPAMGCRAAVWGGGRGEGHRLLLEEYGLLRWHQSFRPLMMALREWLNEPDPSLRERWRGYRDRFFAEHPDPLPDVRSAVRVMAQAVG